MWNKNVVRNNQEEEPVVLAPLTFFSIFNISHSISIMDIFFIYLSFCTVVVLFVRLFQKVYLQTVPLLTMIAMCFL